MATTATKTINGYMIREALKRWDRERKISSTMFDSCLYVFQGEKKPSPRSVMEQFQIADRNYARIQELQQEYNHSIIVMVQSTDNTGNESMRLSLAVKLVGGAGRVEKMWADSITEKKDRYDYDRKNQRSKDVDYATRTISEDECMTLANAASQYRSDLVTAIARANAIDYTVSISDTEYDALFGKNNRQPIPNQGGNR